MIAMKNFNSLIFFNTPLSPEIPLIPRRVDGVLIDEWLQLIVIANLVGDPTGCWMWQGRTGRGYGVLNIHQDRVYIHRLSYTIWKGPIPDGLHIDHLCCTKLCANPSHMEPVTNVENAIRGNRGQGTNCGRGTRRTAPRSERNVCVEGHPLTKENSIPVQYSNGTLSKKCRICYRQYQAAYRRKMKQQRQYAPL